jgi:ATP/maltotriose-dependent transcriptional regulator MalT
VTGETGRRPADLGPPDINKDLQDPMAPPDPQPHSDPRAAAAACRWSEAYDLLAQVDPDDLTPDDLALFADAAWWCCRVEEEIELRQRACAGFVAAGRPRPAAYAAWMLSVRHGLRGQPSATSGWLQRARRHLSDQPECVEHGYVACSETEQALGAGDLDAAARHAARATDIGARFGDAGLVSLGLAWQGLCALAVNDLEQAARCLDEAMTAVAAGELDAHFTGWVYCFAIGMCMGVADLHRAGIWAQQAWRWASSLPEPTPYQGLCRVRQVEVMSLRGELEAAETEAHRACEEMLAFEPHLAGEAFYVTGEILRRRGDLAGAETAFERARELGQDPQPGLAMVRLAQGRVEAAASALRAADAGGPPFRRAALLSARVEVALADDDLATARAACQELDEVADEVPSDALGAMAATARGRVRLAEADAESALPVLRRAMTSWRTLELACEVAETRALVGLAMRELGDREGGELELQSARRAFERLGASADSRRFTLGTEPAPAATPLTARECEVLALVASGSTNRQIAAELVVSEHTVARHLSNIFTKLGVSSRTAAAAYAFEHDLVQSS